MRGYRIRTVADRKTPSTDARASRAIESASRATKRASRQPKRRRVQPNGRRGNRRGVADNRKGVTDNAVKALTSGLATPTIEIAGRASAVASLQRRRRARNGMTPWHSKGRRSQTAGEPAQSCGRPGKLNPCRRQSNGSDRRQPADTRTRKIVACIEKNAGAGKKRHTNPRKSLIPNHKSLLLGGLGGRANGPGGGGGGFDQQRRDVVAAAAVESSVDQLAGGRLQVLAVFD